jgi:uncharacterized membrane protein
MASIDNMSVYCHGMAAIAAAVVATALTLSSPASRSAAAQPIVCTPAASVSFQGNDLGNTADGFLLDNDVFTPIVAPGDVVETAPSDLNNRGQVVGSYVFADRAGQGFLLDNGVYTPIDAPGALATGPLDINNRGQIVGTYSNVSATAPLTPPLHGFLLSHGVYTTIDPPGASSTLTFGISDRGQIVGGYFDADNIPHGFLLDRGTFTTIDAPGAAPSTAVFGINDRGQIVGIRETTGRRANALNRVR